MRRSCTNNYILFPRFPGAAAAAAAPPRIQKNLAEYVDAMTEAGHTGSDRRQRGAGVLDDDGRSHHSRDDSGGADQLRVDQGCPVRRTATLIGFDAPDFNCGHPTWPESPSFCRSYQQVLKFGEEWRRTDHDTGQEGQTAGSTTTLPSPRRARVSVADPRAIATRPMPKRAG